MKNDAKHKRFQQGAWVRFVVLALAVLWFEPAQAFYLCTEPDGTPFLTDFPYEGCVNQEDSTAPGFPSQKKPLELKEKGSPLVQKKSGDDVDEFMDSVRQGDLEAVRSFLASGQTPNVRESTDLHMPAMGWAAALGHVEVMLALLEHGGHVDIFNKKGVTALMSGAFEGQTDAVRFLIERGASVNARDVSGKTPLMFAVAGGGLTAVNIVDLLLKNKGSINSVNSDGGTALIVAAANHSSSLVQNLITHGADLDLKDKQGRTALMWAIERGDHLSIAALKKAGASSADLVESEKNPYEQLDYQGRNREWWQSRLRSLKEEKNQIMIKILDAKRQLDLLSIDMYGIKNSRQKAKLRAEIRSLNAMVQIVGQAIKKDLPEEARKAGALPGWVR